jgi:hypothetical protein
MVMAEDREVIVTNGDGGGSGALVAVIALLLIVALGAFLYFGTNVFRGGGGDTDIKANVKVETPAAPAKN